MRMPGSCFYSKMSISETRDPDDLTFLIEKHVGPYAKRLGFYI